MTYWRSWPWAARQMPESSTYGRSLWQLLTKRYTPDQRFVMSTKLNRGIGYVSVWKLKYFWTVHHLVQLFGGYLLTCFLFIYPRHLPCILMLLRFLEIIQCQTLLVKIIFTADDKMYTQITFRKKEVNRPKLTDWNVVRHLRENFYQTQVLDKEDQIIKRNIWAEYTENTGTKNWTSAVQMWLVDLID